MKKLTLCIPTYNRKDSVVRLVNSITSSDLLDIADVIIVDDGSNDSTFNILKDITSPFRGAVRLIRHDVNKGMAYGFLSFFDESHTEYLMMLADDDRVIPQGVKGVLSFLERIKPDFVSTSWLNNEASGGGLFRGRSREELIQLTDIRHAANHAPGLVYRLPVVLPDVVFLRQRLATGCYASLIFPQVVLVLSLALRRNNCWWCPAAPGGYRNNGSKTSGLHDRDGNHWSSVMGRWNEQKAFAEIYSSLSTKAPSANAKKAADQLLILHNFEVFSRLKSGVAAERPNLVPILNGASAYQNLRHSAMTITALFKYLVKRLYCMYQLRDYDQG